MSNKERLFIECMFLEGLTDCLDCMFDLINDLEVTDTNSHSLALGSVVVWAETMDNKLFRAAWRPARTSIHSARVSFRKGHLAALTIVREALLSIREGADCETIHNDLIVKRNDKRRELMAVRSLLH